MENDTQLARWLAGELDGEELKALENSSRYATLVRIKENFEQIESPQFDSDIVLNKVLRQEKTSAKVIPLYRKYWLHAAAAIVLLFGLGIAFMMANKELSAENGETYAFTLPDASQVMLNSGSTASYNSWNWSNKRHVSLDGEAYFKVAKGKTFEVKTSLGTVTVLGTQFNVKAREGRFDVVCYEGKVRVQFNDSEVVLTPNKSVSFTNGKEGSITQSIVNEPEWLHKEIAFDDENIAGIIAELERKYDVVIKTDFTSAQLFSGSVPANNLDAALKSLCRAYHLEVKKEGNTIILTPLYAGP